ncbi:hypothetical protein [Yoonia maritima]|uniref:hypothetical protein n=1 Tax=Yoonia maritima TaxID=1435347 RepID=UPI000D04D8A8|nr:hypothetical protein [Yoonia maritima]
MKHIIAHFAGDESGAVTVDFVVLTASITMLGLIVVTSFSGGATELADEIDTALDNIDVTLP